MIYKTINYPTREEVEKATIDDLALWHRGLPGPNSSETVSIMGRICDRFDELGGWTNKLVKDVNRKLGIEH